MSLSIYVVVVTFINTGAVYLQDCPKQPYIPIYVLVCGVFGVFLGLLVCLPCAKDSEDGGSNNLSLICGFWNALVSAFLFCWVISGKKGRVCGSKRSHNLLKKTNSVKKCQSRLSFKVLNW